MSLALLRRIAPRSVVEALARAYRRLSFGHMRNVTRGGHAQILYLDDVKYTAVSALTPTSSNEAGTSTRTLGGEPGRSRKGRNRRKTRLRPREAAAGSK